jgi:hypothetical protein
MLQVFYLDIAKLDLDVVYTCLLQAYVSSVSRVLYICYKCFICMLHMFAMVFKHFHKCLKRWFQVFHLSSSVC